MTESKHLSSTLQVALGLMLLFAVGIGIWWLFGGGDPWERDGPLSAALRPLIDGRNTEQSRVARAILENYLETRANASRWSAVYWGFTFAAATLSACAGLILKFETIVKNEGAKKDVAAVFAVAAALLITISSSGDFQRKWQANRIAAAELERTGYEFLEKNGADARTYLAPVGQSLLRRHLAIVGGTEKRAEAAEVARTAAPAK
jgi:hypothetical protein